MGSKSPPHFSTLVVEKCCQYQLIGKRDYVLQSLNNRCQEPSFSGICRIDRVSAIYRLNQVTIPCYIN